MAELRFGVYEHKLVYDSDKLGKQPPVTGPERNATEQLSMARNSGAAFLAFSGAGPSMIMHEAPIK